MEFIKPPETFVFDGPNAPQRWARWDKSFNTYFVAAELDTKSKAVQVARLLNAAGVEAQEIHETFTFANDEEKTDYKIILKKFADYCRPRKNVVFERFRFNNRDQSEDEPVDKWVKDLRIMAKDCEYGDQEDSLIRDRIANGVHDKRVQERMLRENDLSLTRAIDLCRSAETTKCQMLEMSKQSNSTVSVDELNPSGSLSGSAGGSREGSDVRCFTCNGSGHYSNECPSSNRRNQPRCFNCNGTGHMSRECPNGDNFPRGRRRGRGRGHGRGRGGRGRGGRRGGSQDRRDIHDVEEEIVNDYISEFASLSLHSVGVEEDDEFPVLSLHSIDLHHDQPDQDETHCQQEFEEDFDIQIIDEDVDKVVSLDSIEVNEVANSDRPSKRFVKFDFFTQVSKDQWRNVGKGELKIDSGSGRNTMTLIKYRELYPDRVDIQGKPFPEYLEASRSSLEPYGGGNIQHYGVVTLPCRYNNRQFRCKFFLVDVVGPLLLGLPTGEALGIITINVISEVSETVRKTSGNSNRYVDPSTPIEKRPAIRSKEDLKDMYPECFDFNEKYFKDFHYDIKLDPTVEPKVDAPRRIPMELKPTVKKKLDEMVKDGIIKKVSEPTKWVNSLLVISKPNGMLRVCIDPVNLNKAIMREHHPTPVVEDIIPELSGSDLFTKLDLQDGYWHMKLTEESSFLTTFNSPFGRYRWLRVPFGLKVSQDIFQYKIDETYGQCDGTIGIADDITVHGRGEKDHDNHLHATMEKTRSANLCLNYEKIYVKQKSIKFFGNIYSADGVTADPDKIAAIVALRPPENKSELKTFLGMVNYLQQFIPRLSEHTALIRDLEKKDVRFVWDPLYQECFDRVKSLVANSMALAFYDRNKPVTLQTDYSQKGLGAVLVQEGKPIQFASKALVGGEVDLAPIEGEMLAVQYGVKKFHYYLYGRKFTVECDHRPLMHIHKKNLNKAPPRYALC